MIRVLLTGSTGFVGQAFCAYAAQQQDSSAAMELYCLQGRLDDRAAIQAQLKQLQPDVILHLAAMSYVPDCNAEPERAWQTNVMATQALLQDCVAYSPQSSFIFVGSSDCYGASFKSGQAVSEQTLLQPLNVYAATKAAADLMVAQYGLSGQLKTIRLRPFNHTGALQRSDFVVPSFAAQIAAVEQQAGVAEIKVGNLDAQRDFLDVEDVVRAYGMVIEHHHEIESGSVFNIASGQARSIRSVLDQLLALSTVPIAVVTDPARCRPADIQTVQGDASLIGQTLGWQPVKPWQSTLEGILQQQRARLS